MNLDKAIDVASRADMPEARWVDDPDETLRPGHGIVIPIAEIAWRFTTSGGPGGQHANRSNTRVEAMLDLSSVSGIPDEVRDRLVSKLGASVTVAVDDTRSQHRNRQLALERLAGRLAGALVRQKRRRPTAPSRGAEQRRLDSKRRRSQTKGGRGRVKRWD